LKLVSDVILNKEVNEWRYTSYKYRLENSCIPKEVGQANPKAHAKGAGERLA
jgi:hypothetical protein